MKKFDSGSEVVDNTQKLPVESQPDDRSLWLSFKTGNKLAFSLIYKKYYFSLYNYGFHQVPDKDLVKDCLHDLFFYLWENKEKVTVPDSAKSYLFTAFKRKLMDAAKANRRFVGAHHDTDFEISISFEQEIISKQTNEENLYKLQQAINQLTKRQREAVFLRYFENMSYEQIAAIMDCEVNSVYVLMSRAMDVLRNSYCLTAFYIWIESLN